MPVSNKFYYPALIQEVYLDAFGHMNNTMYLTLFEEARWDILHRNGFGFDVISKTGLGPVILAVNMKFLLELRAREEIVIESQILSYDKKIGKLGQKMLRGTEVCCEAEFTFGLFDLNIRKLVLPSPEWLQAMGLGID